MRGKITDQIMTGLKQDPKEFNRVNFGEIVFRVQNGKVIGWDVKQTFKAAQAAQADPKNGRSKP